MNRLTEALNLLPSNPLENYTYDPVGNRTDSNQNGLSQFNVANQLLEDGDFTYQSNNNGNLTRKTAKVGGQITSYEYDLERTILRPDGSCKKIQFIEPTIRVYHTCCRFWSVILRLFTHTGLWGIIQSPPAQRC